MPSNFHDVHNEFRQNRQIASKVQVGKHVKQIVTKFSPFREGNYSKISGSVAQQTHHIPTANANRLHFLYRELKAGSFDDRKRRQAFGTKKESAENYIKKKSLICILHNVLFSL